MEVEVEMEMEMEMPMPMPLAVMCSIGHGLIIARVKPPPAAPAIMFENLMLVCTLCWH